MPAAMRAVRTHAPTLPRKAGRPHGKSTGGTATRRGARPDDRRADGPRRRARAGYRRAERRAGRGHGKLHGPEAAPGRRGRNGGRSAPRPGREILPPALFRHDAQRPPARHRSANWPPTIGRSASSSWSGRPASPTTWNRTASSVLSRRSWGCRICTSRPTIRLPTRPRIAMRVEALLETVRGRRSSRGHGQPMNTIAYSSPFVPAEWIAAHGLRPHRLRLCAGDGPALAAVARGVCPYAGGTDRRGAGGHRRCGLGVDHRLRSDALRGRAAGKARQLPDLLVNVLHLANGRRSVNFTSTNSDGWAGSSWSSAATRRTTPNWRG